jgi:hypothetical protein
VCRGRTDIGYSDVRFIEKPGALAVSALESAYVDLSGVFEFD